MHEVKQDKDDGGCLCWKAQGLGEHVGVEAEALRHGLGLTARGAIGGQVQG